MNTRLNKIILVAVAVIIFIFAGMILLRIIIVEPQKQDWSSINKEDSVVYSNNVYNFNLQVPKTIQFIYSAEISPPYSPAVGNMIGVFIPNISAYEAGGDPSPEFKVFIAAMNFKEPISKDSFINLFQDMARGLCLTSFCRENIQFETVDSSGITQYRINSIRSGPFSGITQSPLLWGFPLYSEDSGMIIGVVSFVPQVDSDQNFNTHNSLLGAINSFKPTVLEPAKAAAPQPSLSESMSFLPEEYKNSAIKGDILLHQNPNMGIEFWYPRDLTISLKENDYWRIAWPKIGSVEPALKLSVGDSQNGGIINDLLGYCAADGPDGGSYCEAPDIDKISIMENKNSINYAVFHTNYVSHYTSRPDEVTNGIGPFAYIPAYRFYYITFMPYSTDGLYGSIEYHDERMDKDFMVIMDTLRFIPLKNPGIGVDTSKVADGYRIDYIFPRSSADLAGLEKGNIILKINNVLTNNITQQEIMNQLRGDLGTNVTLLIQEVGDSNTREVIIKRGLLKLSNSKDQLINN